MVSDMGDGWERSASAWIAAQGADGDFTRKYVVDPVMLKRVAAGSFTHALDVGCGEGRFCRMLSDAGIRATGIDPAPSLIAEAARRDPAGDYRVGQAEALAFDDAAFDLVVSYLSLIDIADAGAAIREMARVLAPGGSLLIANLNSFNTAGAERGWTKDWRGRKRYYPIDDYLETRAMKLAWKGLRVTNWHRPLAFYLQALLGEGLRMVFFDEPAPLGGDAARAAAYRRVPFAHVMEWRKGGG